MAVDPVVVTAERRAYVDFAAIISGAIVATGSVIVLSGFSASLGLSSFSFDEGGEFGTTWFIVTAVFSVVWMVAAYWLGGYIAGRMRRPADDASKDEVVTRDGLHGLVVWGLGMIVGGFILAGVLSNTGGAAVQATETAVEAAGNVAGGAAQGAGQLAGGALSGIGQAAGGLAEGAGQAAAPSLEGMLPQGLKTDPVDYVATALLRPAQAGNARSTDDMGMTGPGTASGQSDDTMANVSAILVNLITTGEIPDDDRAYLKTVVASRTGLSPAEVDARVDQAIDRANEIRATAQDKLESAQAEAEKLKAEAEAKAQEAKEKAEQIAEQARIAAILTAFLLAASALVAAAAAYAGAVRGGQHRDEGRIWGGLAWRRP